MLVAAAEGASDGSCDESKNGEQEQEGRKRGPGVQAADSPTAAPTCEHPANCAITQGKQNEKYNQGQGQTFPHVGENVVTHFVSRDEDNLRRGHLSDGCIPNYDSFRSAESSDVSVEPGRLFARAHPKHPLRWNILSGALNHLFQACRERRVFLRERLEFVEHGIHNQRLKEDEENSNGQGDLPEIKPPTPRAVTDHHIEN